jgi:hypothetical protein
MGMSLARNAVSSLCSLWRDSLLKTGMGKKSKEWKTVAVVLDTVPLTCAEPNVGGPDATSF